MKQHNPGFLKAVADAKTRVREIDAMGLRAMLADGQPLQLVDVREESEYAAGHAVGALHLSKGVIERDIEDKIPQPATRLVLYCGGGYRSALASDSIQKMGYSEVYSLDGGWRAYVESGLPVEPVA